MKKITLTVLAVFALTFANAQDKKESTGSNDSAGFKLGINLGLPLGDIKDAYSVGLGVDLAYMWPISDGFQLGVTTGYAHYLGKTEDVDTGFGIVSVKNDDAGFVPVAASAQISLGENFFLGADLGYAIGVSPSGNNGGLLYQPKVGYQMGNVGIYAGYKGISVTGGTFSSVNLGVNFKL